MCDGLGPVIIVYFKLRYIFASIYHGNSPFPQLAAPANRLAANGKARDDSGKASKLALAGEFPQ